MTQTPQVSTPEFWEQIYLDDDAGWDLNGPTPIFSNWVKKLNSKMSICVLGAGNGHDAVELAKHGHEVYAVDFAQTPIQNIKKASADADVKVIPLEMDIFQLADPFSGYFDAVVEYTCFCAINPKRRPEYATLVNTILKPNGIFAAILFPIDKAEEDGGPPFRVDIKHTLKLFTKQFKLIKCEDSHLSVKPRSGREKFVILRKNGN